MFKSIMNNLDFSFKYFQLWAMPTNKRNQVPKKPFNKNRFNKMEGCPRNIVNLDNIASFYTLLRSAHTFIFIFPVVLGSLFLWQLFRILAASMKFPILRHSGPYLGGNNPHF